MRNEEMKAVFRDFDALVVKERVDAFVSLAEKWNALSQEGTPRASKIRHITVEHGIAEAAEALGEELYEYKAESEMFLYYFYYKGYEFNCLSEKRLGKYAEEAVQALHEKEGKV